MGLGRFGGGVAVSRWIAERGAIVSVTDRENAETLESGVRALCDLNITWRLGGHREEDFTSADVVIVNPAVRRESNPFLAAARDAGAWLTSEIELLLHRLPDRRRVVGVTGSAGKSTTAAMIHAALQAAMGEERVHLGGNLGGSLLPELPRIDPHDIVVVELSSFMLHGLAEAWGPGVAVVTGFAPNHLDWHRDLAEYRAAKQRLLAGQRPADVAVLAPDVADWPVAVGARAEPIRPVDVDDVPPLAIPGSHNRLNAALARRAVAACLDSASTPASDPASGADRLARADAALARFPGLPHRLQVAVEAGGVRFINDSKATTPEATLRAMRCFDPRRLQVILGGADKQAPFDALAQAAAGVHVVYTVGTTGPRLAETIRRFTEASPPDSRVEVVEAGTIDAAVAAALSRLRRGDVLLLSPGFASWDQFEHFERRGAAFVEAVLRYVGEGAPVFPAPD